MTSNKVKNLIKNISVYCIEIYFKFRARFASNDGRKLAQILDKSVKMKNFCMQNVLSRSVY